jgi:hypothetical protein
MRTLRARFKKNCFVYHIFTIITQYYDESFIQRLNDDTFEILYNIPSIVLHTQENKVIISKALMSR